MNLSLGQQKLHYVGGVGGGVASDPWDKTSFHAYAKGGNSWAESQASRAFVCLMSA